MTQLLKYLLQQLIAGKKTKKTSASVTKTNAPTKVIAGKKAKKTGRRPA